VKKKFKELLHAYKVAAFHISHRPEEIEAATRAIVDSTDEALNNAYSYQFRRDPNPERVELFNNIKNYVTRAVLPPVVEKIMRRVVILEQQQQAFVKLVESILEELSAEETAGSSAKVG
jgi:hypothetical protein